MKKKPRLSKQTQKSLRTFRKVFLTLAFLLITLSSYWASEHFVRVELPSSDHPPALYANQAHQDLRQTFVQGIKQAKESVNLVIYTLTDHAIIQALRDKADEGIQVKVLVDGKATPFIDRKLGPKVEVVKRYADGIMHMKILMIDHALTFVGSANMTGESLQMHGNLVTALNSPAFAAYVKKKIDTLPEEGPAPPFSESKFVFANQPLEMWFLPDKRDASTRIKQLIGSANKTIRIAMFTWTRMDFAEAIVAKAKEGVKVEVAMDHYSGKGTSAKVVDYLKKSGIPVRLSTGTALLHYKFLYIDDQVLVNGSANWTKAAFTQNDDCFFVLTNLTEEQKKHMNFLWTQIIAETNLAAL